MTFGPSISELERADRAGRARAGQLDREFIEKTAIANNLNQFRREKELLEQQLREALAELPEEKKVDELLLLFQDRAQQVRPRDRHDRAAGAVRDRFYARLPIPMTVTGNFHEIATFFDALGRMRRIVNVNDILLDTPKDANGKIVLNAKFLATAFMFVETASPGPAAGGRSDEPALARCSSSPPRSPPACGDSPKPAPPPRRRPWPPLPSLRRRAGAREAPEKAPEWSYSSVGKRDPFRSYLSELSKQSGALATRCATPLGRFELEQLKLVAVVTGLENPVAMVRGAERRRLLAAPRRVHRKERRHRGRRPLGRGGHRRVGGARRRHPRPDPDRHAPPARGGAEPRGVAPMKIHHLRLAVVLCGALAVPARAAEPNAIRAVDVAERDGAIEVSIQGTRPPSYTVFKLQDPPRLVVDLAGADVSRLASPVAVKKGGVAGSRPRSTRTSGAASDASSSRSTPPVPYEVAPRGMPSWSACSRRREACRGSGCHCRRGQDSEAVHPAGSIEAGHPERSAAPRRPRTRRGPSADDHVVSRRVDEGGAGSRADAHRRSAPARTGSSSPPTARSARSRSSSCATPRASCSTCTASRARRRAPVKGAAAFTQIRFGKDQGKIRVVLDAAGELPGTR